MNKKKLTSIIIATLSIVIVISLIVKNHFCLNITFGDISQDPQCDPKWIEQREKNNKTIYTYLEKNTKFQCITEVKPTIAPEINQLYLYAYHRELKYKLDHSIWSKKEEKHFWERENKEEIAFWNDIARYYRLAAEYGDYRANERLQNLIQLNMITFDKNKTTELKLLIDRLAIDLPARAKYLNYLLNSKPDLNYEMIIVAAELGDADAQESFANVLSSSSDESTYEQRKKLSDQASACASKNGNWHPTNWMVGNLKSERVVDDHVDKDQLMEALKYNQLGLRQGDAFAATTLAEAFDLALPKKEEDKYYFKEKYLGVANDKERSQRYEKINQILSSEPYFSENIPVVDLDQIVPLPPVKLPAWDGKIAFQRWFESSDHPKPSEERLRQLAQAKRLDHLTGKGLVETR